MLYTTQQIADKYGGENKNVTPYMITHTWIPNGLKCIRGKGKGYLFKIEWVEEFLENLTTIENNQKKNTKIYSIKNTITNTRNRIYTVS